MGRERLERISVRRVPYRLQPTSAQPDSFPAPLPPSLLFPQLCLRKLRSSHLYNDNIRTLTTRRKVYLLERRVARVLVNDDTARQQRHGPAGADRTQFHHDEGIEQEDLKNM